MFRKILFCYDGSAEGRNALKVGADVALCMRAEAHLLAIIRPQPGPMVPEGYGPGWFDEENRMARAVLHEGVNWLKERGLAAHGYLAFGNAIPEIVSVAQNLHPDLIVVGHRHRSRLARWWSEDEEATLLDLVSCSILVSVQEPDASV